MTTALTRMTKVEVVVSGQDASAVRDVITAVGATGFTSVSGVSGLGHHGYHQGRLLFNQQATLELIITVVPDDKVEALLAGLRRLWIPIGQGTADGNERLGL